MTMTKELLHKVADELVEELIPIAVTALQGLIAGRPPAAVITVAQRTTLAAYAQRRMDAALKRSSRKSPPLPAAPKRSSRKPPPLPKK